jgi:cytochrome b6-f complex iron-sulfur subunit
MIRIKRSQFLEFTWKAVLGLCSAIGLGGVFRYLSYPSNPAPPTQFDLGLPENYPPDSKTLIPNAKAILIHNSQGFHALSLICPHLGCEVGETSIGFSCPCHGSRFDTDGKLVHGPAKNNLRILQVTLNQSGHLVLLTG